MFRPMLASPADISAVRYPVLASPKVDGLRAIVRGGCLLSRKLLPIPNRHLQDLYARPEYEGFDGELVVGDPSRATVFETSDVVMEEHEGIESVFFLVFDLCNLQVPYMERYRRLREMAPVQNLWEQKLIFEEAELMDYVASITGMGYEGVIIRDLNSPYKFGRSTVREGWMLKIKNFSDAECIIVGMDELYSNQNPAELNDLGLTKRSSHQANKVPMNKMGSLLGIYNGQEIRLGTGFTDAQRIEIWQNPDKYLRKYAKFKFQSTGGKSVETGGKGIRPPYVFLGWRHELDMDAPSVERAT